MKHLSDNCQCFVVAFAGGKCFPMDNLIFIITMLQMREEKLRNDLVEVTQIICVKVDTSSLVFSIIQDIKLWARSWIMRSEFSMKVKLKLDGYLSFHFILLCLKCEWIILEKLSYYYLI